MWTEQTFAILGTPSHLAALALEIDRDERTGAEWWPLWARRGRLMAGLFHVYGWPIVGPAVMIRINADDSDYGPDFWEPDLCIVRHGWINAHSLPGTPERTKARVWLPWGTDDGRAVQWAWGKLYAALLVNGFDPVAVIEGGAPEPQPAPKRKTRGTSKQTDANAREALRLYHDENLTQQVIAERKAVSVETVKRWLKRARELPDGTE